MSNYLEEMIKENLTDLPSEETFVIGEVDANEEGIAILNLMGEGYSYLEAVDKLEKERREKEYTEILKEFEREDNEDNDPSGIFVWHRDEPGDFDW